MQQTVQQILRRDFASFRRSHGLPLRAHKAARALMSCRTAELGGHKSVCANGHTVGVWYNSCRHRFCPQCSWGSIDRWLESKKKVLLPVPHRHVTFTIPHELLPLWRYNRRALSNLLFEAVRETLLQLMRDERWCGGTPGLILSQHTWTRSLLLHPHIHCLVTEGGVSEKGRWRKPKKSIFLPGRVLSRVFEGKFQSKLEKAIDSGGIRMPPDLTTAGALRLLKRASTHDWVVDVQKQYLHGEGVATYLARYLRGGPIKNQRLLRPFEGKIRLRPRSSSSQVVCLSSREFLRRLFEHVPPRGHHLVRSAGLYHHSNRMRVIAFGHPDRTPPTSFEVPEAPERCRYCQAPVERIGVRPSRPPPVPS
jgi:hypothetical protein